MKQKQSDSPKFEAPKIVLTMIAPTVIAPFATYILTDLLSAPELSFEYRLIISLLVAVALMFALLLHAAFLVYNAEFRVQICEYQMKQFENADQTVERLENIIHKQNEYIETLEQSNGSNATPPQPKQISNTQIIR